MSGLGAVLRVSGSKAAVEKFLSGTKWSPLSVFWKGKKRSEHSRSVSKINGFNVNVSDASGLNLSKQVKDAIHTIRRDGAEFRRLRRLKLHAVLDFAVEVEDSDGPAFFRFPSELLQLLAGHGVSLEVSYYGRQPCLLTGACSRRSETLARLKLDVRRPRVHIMSFRVGDKVVKNPLTWKPNSFDEWGRGEGVGIVVEPPFYLDGRGVDVRWPHGRCFEEIEGLLPAGLESSANSSKDKR